MLKEGILWSAAALLPLSLSAVLCSVIRMLLCGSCLPRKEQRKHGLRTPKGCGALTCLPGCETLIGIQRSRDQFLFSRGRYAGEEDVFKAGAVGFEDAQALRGGFGLERIQGAFADQGPFPTVTADR